MFGPNVGGRAGLSDSGGGGGAVQKFGNCFALVEGPKKPGHWSAVLRVGDLQTVPKGLRLLGYEVAQICCAVLGICEVRCGCYACL